MTLPAPPFPYAVLDTFLDDVLDNTINDGVFLDVDGASVAPPHPPLAAENTDVDLSQPADSGNDVGAALLAGAELELEEELISAAAPPPAFMSPNAPIVTPPPPDVDRHLFDVYCDDDIEELDITTSTLPPVGMSAAAAPTAAPTAKCNKNFKAKCGLCLDISGLFRALATCGVWRAAQSPQLAEGDDRA